MGAPRPNIRLVSMVSKKNAVRAVTPPVLHSTPEPILVDLKGAALLLGSTVWTVRDLLWDKKLPYVKIGRRFLIDVSDIRAFVTSLKTAA
jgi:excisionase family DNA binding protein